MSVNEKMTAIADAIRAKTGGTEALTLDQMATAIGGIQTGSNPLLEELTISENGEYTPGEGMDGFSKVVANVQANSGLEEQYIRLMTRGGSYSDLCTFVVPESITYIGDNLFREWYYCERVIFHDQFSRISANAFYYCGSLTELDFPPSLTSIGCNAFGGCSKITKVTFRSKPTIHDSAFSACSGITEINVPWAEGEVAGAPWGATNDQLQIYRSMILPRQFHKDCRGFYRG